MIDNILKIIGLFGYLILVYDHALISEINLKNNLSIITISIVIGYLLLAIKNGKDAVLKDKKNTHIFEKIPVSEKNNINIGHLILSLYYASIILMPIKNNDETIKSSIIGFLSNALLIFENNNFKKLAIILMLMYYLFHIKMDIMNNSTKIIIFGKLLLVVYYSFELYNAFNTDDDNNNDIENKNYKKCKNYKDE